MRRTRGFTLLELMVALVVTAFALSGALLMVQAQQRLFYSGSKTRQSQQGGRAALLYLEQKIPLAGFGLDPATAFDFAWYLCPGGGCTRDAVNAPDELIFYARSPAARVLEVGGATTYFGRVWETVSVDSGTLTVTARGGETFAQGQIFQLVCRNKFVYTHVTLARTHPNVAAGPVALELLPASPSVLAPNVPADPFRRQDAADRASLQFKKWNECLSINPRAFQVDRYRFYVRPVNMGGGRWDPYLVLDQGIDSDGDGDIDLDDEILVAEGIENLQVAYSFLDPNMPAAGTVPGSQIAVPAPGSAPTNTAQTITPTEFPGAYDATKAYPLLKSADFFVPSSRPLDPKRQTNHQGNIRGVQIALVARSPEPDPGSTSNLSYGFGSALWVMNFNQLPPWISGYRAANGNEDRYMRAVLTSTIELPSMASRGLMPN
jgi:type IV pilus assembly protein PilW